MLFNRDIVLMKKIFHLSDLALVHMVNHLFGTEYPDDAQIWRDDQERDESQVWLTVAGMNRYVFSIRYFKECLQILAEDRGGLYYDVQSAASKVMRIKEPQAVYFGEKPQTDFVRILEFPGNERVKLSIHSMTLADTSCCQLAEMGLVVFLPLLFHYLAEFPEEEKVKEKKIRQFVLKDMPNALKIGVQKGDLDLYDAEKQKQLCRQIAWRLLSQKEWMQNLEFQELLLDAFDANLDMLKRLRKKEE